MNENPDAVPGSASGSSVSLPADISLTRTAQQYLDQTRPWVRFMSLLIFITAAFMVIAGFGLFVLGIGRGILPDRGGFGELRPAQNLFMGLLYVLSAILYVAPGVFLWRFAGAIRLLKTSRSPQALEDALRSQKSFWRYLGVLSIIGIALMAIVIVLAFFAAIFFMTRR